MSNVICAGIVPATVCQHTDDHGVNTFFYFNIQKHSSKQIDSVHLLCFFPIFSPSTCYWWYRCCTLCFFTCERHEECVVSTNTVTWWLSEIGWGHTPPTHFLTVIHCVLTHPPSDSRSVFTVYIHIQQTFFSISKQNIDTDGAKSTAEDCHWSQSNRHSCVSLAPQPYFWFGLWQMMELQWAEKCHKVQCFSTMWITGTHKRCKIQFNMTLF